MGVLPSSRIGQREAGLPAREAAEGTLQASFVHPGIYILGSNKVILIALEFQIWKEEDEDQNPNLSFELSMTGSLITILSPMENYNTLR